MKKENICNNCRFKIENTGINEKGFCEIGYTQNPTTEKATINALKNKAVLCFRNKFASAGSARDTKWSIAELLLSHPDTFNKEMMKFENIDANLNLYLK